MEGHRMVPPPVDAEQPIAVQPTVGSSSRFNNNQPDWSQSHLDFADVSELPSLQGAGQQGMRVDRDLAQFWEDTEVARWGQEEDPRVQVGRGSGELGGEEEYGESLDWLDEDEDEEEGARRRRGDD